MASLKELSLSAEKAYSSALSVSLDRAPCRSLYPTPDCYLALAWVQAATPARAAAPALIRSFYLAA